MTDYFPIIICPRCKNISIVGKEYINDVVCSYFENTLIKKQCEKCKFNFSIAVNWGVIKQEN
jgi:hypothetical protein